MDASTRFDTRVVGALPVISNYLERLELARIIDDLVPWEGDVPLGTLVEIVAGVLQGSILPQALEAMMHSGLAQVTATLLDAQMRHAGVRAMARVVERLGIEADVVLFGHVHRRGPIDGEIWPADNGTRFINTGSWLYEPLLVDRARPPHGYWPGGAVLLEPGRPPRSVGLLDDLGAADLRAPWSTSADGGESAVTRG